MMNLFLSGTKIETKWIVIIAVIAVILVGLIVFLIAKPKKKQEEPKNEPKKEETNTDTKVEVAKVENKEVVTKNEPIKENKVTKEKETIAETKPVIEPLTVVKNEEENKEETVKQEETISETKPEETVVKEEKQKKQVYGKYEVFPAGKFYLYRLKASNGETLVVSDIYKTFNGVRDAIDTVKKNIESGTLVINQEKHGLWQFKLFSLNKRLLVESANYDTKQRCESACESFKRFAFISPVVNLEEDNEHLLELVTLTKEQDKVGGKLVLDDYEEGKENSYKLIASNGHVLCTSIPYKTNQALITSLDSLKDAFNNGTVFLFKDKKDTYQFKLYNQSLRLMVFSESYKTKANAISAANSCYSFINLAEKELPENFK